MTLIQIFIIRLFFKQVKVSSEIVVFQNGKEALRYLENGNDNVEFNIVGY
jgi:hypothetical protein